MNLWKRLAAVSLVLALACGFMAAGASSTEAAASSFGRPHIDKVRGSVGVLSYVEVVDFGRVIYRGRMDVNPTINRIRDGRKLNHRNDGSTFQNREGKLPRKSSGYYKEFVHQMSGMPFPGPQRVVIGQNGEVYYTGDHYKSFHRCN